MGARGVGEPGDPHPIAHPGADARPAAEGREQGGLDVDRFREEAPPTGRGEEGQEGESSGVEDHPHHRARDGQQRHNQEQVGSHSTSAVDSGASETVISEDMLPNIPIKQEERGAVRGCQRRAHPEPR